MTRNATQEIQRYFQVRKYGLATVLQMRPPDPPVKLELPGWYEKVQLDPELFHTYQRATGAVSLGDGSNNWVVDGTLSATGKPLLANDPHRALTLPSLRKTVHLVAPGWNAIGAGEPALPGIALGHNEEVAFGFTIVNIDQQDLFLETLNPENSNQYKHSGAWKNFEIERQTIDVKGEAARTVSLKYGVHGPVIYENPKAGYAVSLRWAGAEPGGAGYLPALRLARAKNWTEFKEAASYYKVPSENLIYADRAGNIGWIAAGLTPIRKNGAGLMPATGETGEYDWTGWLTIDQMPQRYNPPERWIATANANHLPKGYPHRLGHEFSAPFRYERLAERFAPPRKWTVEDFARMQYDTTSIAARRFQKSLAQWNPNPPRSKSIRDRLLKWDARIEASSTETLIYEAWVSILPRFVFGQKAEIATPLGTLRALESVPNHPALAPALDAALAQLEKALGPEGPSWTWGTLHRIGFRHPAGRNEFHIAPAPFPGDPNTVLAAGWPAEAPFAMNHGASYRQVLDLSNWDASVMTNVPGESGDPASPHYKDLFKDWLEGKHHPMPYSRAAVEAAARERMQLTP
jgi:penicillin amidase